MSRCAWGREIVLNDTLTAVDGVRVGHHTDTEQLTGLTVIVLPPDSTAGVSVRGAAPGTREVGLLRPGCTVDQVDALMLTGGSAFGLDAASGVMRYLAERGRGVPVGDAVVPIVPAAVLFDLMIGKNAAPDADDAYLACENSCSGEVEQGSAGAGTGCTVGKVLGPRGFMRGGLGSAAVFLQGGGTVGAVAAVNSVGDVVDERGVILAGALTGKRKFASSEKVMLEGAPNWLPGGGNTVLVAVVTDVIADKTACSRMAEWAHDGLARSIRPCHTSADGDTVFFASTGRVSASLDRVGVAAVLAVAESVRRAVAAASAAQGVPALGDL